MSAANYRTMEDFPLIVSDDVYCKICPECGLAMGVDDDKCECGQDISDVSPIYDYDETEDRLREMSDRAAAISKMQDFYDVSVIGGYYGGMQFYVEDRYENLEEMDNEDARYKFGVCRSEMLRKYNVATNKVRRELLKAAKELGCNHLACIGVFSNGEAVYRKIA